MIEEGTSRTERWEGMKGEESRRKGREGFRRKGSLGSYMRPSNHGLSASLLS